MRKCIGILVLSVGVVSAVPLLSGAWSVLYGYREEKRQGRLVVDEIQARDASINAGWSPGVRRVAISVYALTKEEDQERVVEWVYALKAKGEVDCIVVINFYERENWIETPKNANGVWSSRRGEEKL